MRVADRWVDYELIDVSSGERLERWNDIILIRPDPQVIWKTPKNDKRWFNADAHYYRSKNGGGKWDKVINHIDPWLVSYNCLKFKIGTLGFKHTGVFPEQAVNWDFCEKLISSQPFNMNILNLFAYTGGATLACSKAGARVCHVDASKGMVSWAKENAELSGLSNNNIRWIVDDCVKFVQKEYRRGHKYDGVIMDPPSFGRGPKGEFWKIEENLYDFIVLCEKILSDNAKFLMINSYTSGFSASVIEYMIHEIIQKKRGGDVISDDIGLKVTTSNGILPAGSTSIWIAN